MLTFKGKNQEFTALIILISQWHTPLTTKNFILRTVISLLSLNFVQTSGATLVVIFHTFFNQLRGYTMHEFSLVTSNFNILNCIPKHPPKYFLQIIQNIYLKSSCSQVSLYPQFVQGNYFSQTHNRMSFKTTNMKTFYPINRTGYLPIMLIL